jgi:hypothetical protein
MDDLASQVSALSDAMRIASALGGFDFQAPTTMAGSADAGTRVHVEVSLSLSLFFCENMPGFFLPVWPSHA